MTGFSEQFSAAAEGGAGAGTGGVGFGLKGLGDPNADSLLKKLDKNAGVDADGRTFESPSAPGLLETLVAPVVDLPKVESAPLPGANAQLQPKGPTVSGGMAPSVDRLDPAMQAGRTDQNLGRKAEDLGQVSAAQNLRMAQLKDNAGSITRPQGTGPQAQAGANLGGPSLAGRALNFAMPSVTGLALTGAAAATFGPAAAGVVAAVDMAVGAFQAIRPTSSHAEVALKGQGTYSDAKTDSRIPQYGYKGQKPQELFSYASAKPVEQMAQRVSPSAAPIALDSSPSGRGRLSADDLWKPGQMADTSIRLGPNSTRAASEQMAALRAEMDKTGAYAGLLARSANSPLDMNVDNLTRAMESGTNLKIDDLVDRRALQVRPPQLAMA